MVLYCLLLRHLENIFMGGEKMKLKGIKIIGVITVNNETGLMLEDDKSKNNWFTEILADKKGIYIKLDSKYLDIPETTRKMRYYIKGELWWAVNRFEEYLKNCDESQ